MASPPSVGRSLHQGSIPYAWIASACRLPGSGLHVATACRFLCGRYRGPNRWGLDAIAKGLRISEQSARRGLHTAELAGLLAVERVPGCKLAVSVLDLTGPESKAGPTALVRADSVELVAPCLPAPRKVPPRRGRLLVAGRLGAIGRVRAGVGGLGGFRPLSVFGLPGPG